jgi:hypothetical protein
MKISLIYNLDTRPKFLDEYQEINAGSGGCQSIDFFIEGLENKIKFFEGYELEVIVYIDIHEEIPGDTVIKLNKMKAQGVINVLIIEPHTDERYGSDYSKNNNDLIYAECLSLATGDYVAHFDSDVIAYKAPGVDMFEFYRYLLDKYLFVSIPSNHSPHCVPKDHPILEPLGYQWASTRFFICRRETLPSLVELKKCFDNNYLKNKYGLYALPNCIEHILGVIAGPDQVYYPPLEMDSYFIASWASYHQGTIETLNKKDYNIVKKYIVDTCGGIQGVGDVVCNKFKKERGEI